MSQPERKWREFYIQASDVLVLAVRSVVYPTTVGPGELIPVIERAAYEELERQLAFYKDGVHEENIKQRFKIEELKAEVKRLRWLESGQIHTCHDECERPECVQRRRIEELEREVERLKKEDARNGARIHLQSQTMADLEQKLAAAKAERDDAKRIAGTVALENAQLRERVRELESERDQYKSAARPYVNERCQALGAKLQLAVEALEQVEPWLTRLSGRIGDMSDSNLRALVRETLEKLK